MEVRKKLPSRERSHIPPGEKDNHLQKCLGRGYVTSQEATRNQEETERFEQAVCVVSSTFHLHEVCAVSYPIQGGNRSSQVCITKVQQNAGCKACNEEVTCAKKNMPHRLF